MWNVHVSSTSWISTLQALSAARADCSLLVFVPKMIDGLGPDGRSRESQTNLMGMDDLQERTGLGQVPGARDKT